LKFTSYCDTTDALGLAYLYSFPVLFLRSFALAGFFSLFRPSSLVVFVEFVLSHRSASNWTMSCADAGDAGGVQSTQGGDSDVTVQGRGHAAGV